MTVMSLFRPRGPARIKAYFLRWIFLFAFFAGGLDPFSVAHAQMGFGGYGGMGFGVMGGMAMGGMGGGGCMIPMQCYGMPQQTMMGGGAGGLMGMLGGAFTGMNNMYCPQKMYASGVGFGPGGTPWYTEGCPQMPMMNMGMGGCMAPWYCGGMPFPQPRQTVVKTRSCKKMVCERIPGGGLGTTPSENPTIIEEPKPVVEVKPPPRQFVPLPETPKPQAPPIDFGEPPVITTEPTPLPPFPAPPIVAGPPPQAPLPVSNPPNKQEGSLRSVDPSRRCLERRQAYLDSLGTKQTEALSCPDPEGELCKGKKNSALPSLISTFGIEDSAASGAQDVLAQIYQDCRVLEIDNVICAGGSSVKNKKGELVQISGVTVTRLAGDVLQRTVNGPLNHEYHTEICGDPKTAGRKDDCKLVCTDPALFNWAGKPKLILGKNGSVTLDLDDAGSESKNQIVKNGKTVKSRRGHDCSGGVAGFLLAKGFLFKPVEQGLASLKEQDRTVGFGGNQAVHMGSDVLVDAGDKPDTCFETVRLEGDHPLRPGDIISKASHTMMIERLDKGWESDPFGMACWGEPLDEKGGCKNKKAETQFNQVDCSKASPSHFRFDLIQSAGMDSKGYIRTPAYDFFAQTCRKPLEMNRCPTADQGGGADLETGTAMMRLAVKYCEARKSGGSAPKAKIGTSETTVGIIRHFGKNKKGCTMPKPKINNDDCVNCKKGGGK